MYTWALEALLPMLQQLCSDPVYMVDHLIQPWPLGVQLERDFWGPEMSLPAEMMAMDALSKPLRNGVEVLRSFNLDELSLQLKTRGSVNQLAGFGTLLRHSWVTILGAAQGAGSVHPKLAPLVTVVGHTHTPSAKS